MDFFVKIKTILFTTYVQKKHQHQIMIKQDGKKFPTFNLFDELRVLVPGILGQVDWAFYIRWSLKFLRDDAEIVTNILTQVDRPNQVLQSLCLLGNLEKK